jgi:Xaa-Pro aminopeptidase
VTIASRLQKLRKLLGEADLDAILISSPENRRYLSGFVGTAGYLLISQTDALLVTDSRYVEQAGRQAPEYRVVPVSGGHEWLPELASELNAKRIGFESDHMTVGGHAAFRKAIGESDGLSLVEVTDAVDKMRATKYEEELSLLTRAIEITDQAFEEVRSSLEAGASERQVAWDLERAMRERGAEGMAFDVIVAAGVNSAMPHHAPDDSVIGTGEPVVIDMGAKYMGYCADMTRTIVIGEPDETFRRVYSTVLDAQLAAEKGVKSGMTGADVDALARDAIVEAGFGKNFGHGLGHGVGLAIHELPTLGSSVADRLNDGMVFTVEPGIYLPDWGGVRIEDVVVLENGRARVITEAPKMDVTP